MILVRLFTSMVTMLMILVTLLMIRVTRLMTGRRLVGAVGAEGC